MSEQETGQWIPGDDPVAGELRAAVHAGDVETVQRLLRNDPALAAARLGSKDSGSAAPLHLVADWPGYSAAVLPVSRDGCNRSCPSPPAPEGPSHPEPGSAAGVVAGRRVGLGRFPADEVFPAGLQTGPVLIEVGGAARGAFQALAPVAASCPDR
jgi:hypothetical protein